MAAAAALPTQAQVGNKRGRQRKAARKRALDELHSDAATLEGGGSARPPDKRLKNARGGRGRGGR